MGGIEPPSKCLKILNYVLRPQPFEISITNQIMFVNSYFKEIRLNVYMKSYTLKRITEIVLSK